MARKAREAAQRPRKRSPYKRRVAGIAVHRERWQLLVNAIADAFNRGTVIGDDEQAVRWAAKKAKEIGPTFENMISLVDTADAATREARAMNDLAVARERLYRRGIKHAIEKFREYERLHRAKETAEGRLKANINAEMAKELEELLTLQDQQPAFYEVIKTCLTVLCAVRDAQFWSPAMIKDITSATEGCREIIKKYGAV